MIINGNKESCYRICHLQNLPHILQEGLCTKHHPCADPNFVSIGHTSIIGKRDCTPVRIEGYGNIGDYVPFYFTPRSIMLYNIVTGYRDPVVRKVERENILMIRTHILSLSGLARYFFTDGQAIDALTTHFDGIESLEEIDWVSIQKSDFTNSATDSDKQRRYQAEFLVHGHVPVSSLESFIVYNEKAANFVKGELLRAEIDLPVYIIPEYFF